MITSYLTLDNFHVNHSDIENLIKKKDPENFTNEQLKLINTYLDKVKICDPAIGSGAFPMGLLHEIISVKETIAYHLQQPFNPADEKTNIIQNSIYGVDIEKGAVDIARLRFWLSLVVDEEPPKPLPNLDYKIVEGNSLLSKFEDEVIEIDWNSKNYKQTDIFSSENHNNIQNLLKKISRKRSTLFREVHNQLQFQINNTKIAQPVRNNYPSNKAYEKALIEYNKVLGWKNTIKKLNHLQKHPEQPFKHFDWKLDFPEVLNPLVTGENNGFDIVIGNPPYIQLQKDGGYLAEELKHANFETFERTGDIYALFYEKDIQLLKNGGHLCFITSNKWMRANYGKSLRKFFSKYNPLILLDLGPGVFPSATVDTNILIIAKEKSEKQQLKALTLNDKNKIYKLKDNDFTTLTNLTEDSWIILTPQEQKIKQRIEQIGTPLKDWDISINYGIKTGYNEAFIINGETKDKLIAKDPKSAEIIKPILRGRDIKRYKAEFADLWLINTHNGYYKSSPLSEGWQTKSDGVFVPPVDINNYPAIKKHLDQYWEKLKKRQDKGVTPYNLRNCAYLEEFEKEKIVYNDISQQLAFSLCEKSVYFNNTVYFITNSIYNRYFVSVLNTKLIDWYYKRTSAQLGEKAVRLFSIYVQNIPIPKIPIEQQKPFETLVDYILFLKQQENNAQSFYFEQIIDGMVYELYFEEEIHQAGCEIIKHLSNLPEINDEMSDSEKQKIINTVFTKLYDKNHPVHKNLEAMKQVEEVKIINRKLS